MLIGFGAAGVGAPTAVLRGVGWDAVAFVTGIFVVATAVREVGLTDRLGAALFALAGAEPARLLAATSFAAAGMSAVLNNHPTAGIMALAIKDMAVPATFRALLAGAALIGGDLGPKMLPIGSLAALLWLRILTDRGVHVSVWLFVKIGVPVTVFAIAIATSTLILEIAATRAIHSGISAVMGPW
jgi:arsenical pump membrane protein